MFIKKNSATKRHSKKTGVKAMYAKILPAVHFEGGETAEDCIVVGALERRMSFTNAYMPQTTKATAATKAMVPMDMGILWHTFKLRDTRKPTTLFGASEIGMPKSFLFPETNSERAMPAPNENGLRRCFSPGSFAVFERCGFAAPFSCGGFAPPVGAAALVRAISSILHHIGNCKVELAAAQGAAARAYCSLASNSNWRFRFREKENFLFIPLAIRDNKI
jgi:hypothetical protein